MAGKDRTKRERLLKLLDMGMVMVHLDARSADVSVPPQFACDPHLRLNLSYRFRPCDIEVTEDHVQATLTFGGEPWLCHVPLAAVFGMTSHVSGESLLWLEDVPEEVLFAIMAADAAQARVPEVEPFGPEAEPEMSHAVGQEVRRGHLRLVK